MISEIQSGMADYQTTPSDNTRHHVLVCVPCSVVFSSLDSLIGLKVRTICDRQVIYRISLTWCSDCVMIRNAEAYEGVCGICDRDILNLRLS